MIRSVKTTEHTVIALWDAHTTRMIAANQDGLLCNLTSLDAFTAINVPSNYISVPATYLNAKYGGFPTMPDISATYDIPEGRVLVEARVLRDVYGLHWIVYIAILESDVTGAIEASKRKVIITSVTIALAMLAMAAALSFAVTLPLLRLTRIMRAATEMDFSAVKDGYLVQRSFIKEIARMQGVFAEMLTRFATAIERNRRLIRSTRPTNTSSMMGPAATG
ncbi:hypothetical protein HDU89_008924 [Geranomyces variabilis]|nr:hypothetical protein HDU89_008924 [Geranomyces variabilis]